MHPAGVEAFDEFERPLGRGDAIVQEGPGFLVVRLDGGPVLGEREPDADDRVHVRVSDMVDELADSPAALAVGCVELRVVEAGDGVAQFLGQIGEHTKGSGAVDRRDGVGALEAADRVARVGCGFWIGYMLCGTHGENVAQSKT